MEQVIAYLVGIMLLSNCNDRGLLEPGVYQYVLENMPADTPASYVLAANVVYHQMNKYDDAKCRQIGNRVKELKNADRD
jgi:hypothetical protein